MSATPQTVKPRVDTVDRTLLRDRPLSRCPSCWSARVVFCGVQPADARPRDWVSVILRASIPLAILAGCQTMTMLTGGIDLSVGFDRLDGWLRRRHLRRPARRVATGVIVALGPRRWRPRQRHRRRRLPRPPADRDPGHGPGGPRVLQCLAAGHAQTSAACRSRFARRQRTIADFVPFSLIIFVPVALLIVFGLRRTGYGRMLFAIGDNPIAARLSGVQSWQVLILLYVYRAVLAAIAGLIYAGLTPPASRLSPNSCCRQLRPRSSAAHRSWAAAAATRARCSARSSWRPGTLLYDPATGAVAPDRLRLDHRLRRCRVRACRRES